jgi:hypothetical protein
VLLLGHLGFGSALARPLSRGLELRLVLVGTLLPDLLDKPLYYGLALATGRSGAQLGLVSGTRTFGHTALLLLALLIAARWRRSAVLLALALGMATHAPLDIGLDLLTAKPESTALLAFTFPMGGLRFAVLPFRDPLQHLGGLLDTAHVATEVLGAVLLAWTLRRSPGWVARARPAGPTPGAGCASRPRT